MCVTAICLVEKANSRDRIPFLAKKGVELPSRITYNAQNSHSVGLLGL